MKAINEIRSFRGEYWFLSNFYPCAIIHDGLEYRSLEAAFQAAKCCNLSDRAQFAPLEAAAAKKLGGSVALRDDWKNVKLIVLMELVRLKFTYNPGLLGRLLATGGALLREGNTWHDNYYGDCACVRCRDIAGKNHLGVELMLFRRQMMRSIGRFCSEGVNPSVIYCPK